MQFITVLHVPTQKTHPCEVHLHFILHLCLKRVKEPSASDKRWTHTTYILKASQFSCVAKIKYCISKSLERKATPSIKRWPGLASRSASYTSAVFKTHQWPAVLHGCHVSSLQHGLCSLFWVSPASPFWCYEYLLEHQMCTNTLVRKVPSTKAQLALVWAILDQICSVQWFGHFS